MEDHEPKEKRQAKRRRGHGEGSIFQRPDGRWCAVIDLGWSGGKRQRKYVYGATRKEAANKLSDDLHRHHQGLPIKAARQTIAQFLDHWLENCIKPTTRRRTYASYSAEIRLHITPGLGHIALTKLSPQQVQKYINQKLDSGLSAKTVRYQRGILRQALGQAVKWSIIARNVAQLVDPPRVKKFEVIPITPEESREFLAAVCGERLEALFTVVLAMGLRRGEALGLRWSDLDLENRILRVNQQLQRFGGDLVIEELKTAKSRRTLSIPSSLILKIREHRQRQLTEKLAAGSRWVHTGLVFTARLGKPLDPRGVKRTLDRILSKQKCNNCGDYSAPADRCEKCDEAMGERKQYFRHYRIHDLRHFFASLLLAQGVSLKVISELLGHSGITISSDIYLHVLPALQHDAANMMDRILKGNV